MRLTLRTLLAWLDDTLSPTEVREIGKQVAESPFAKDLVDRVHRVTRQRRLTVPSRSGPDATDPNLVSSYLDNELSAEEVAEFEKRCLTSDVHLAEVASVHQILSLIGQKAKVPAEARHRMYHLVKGRESVASKAPRASLAEEPGPVSEPIQPWVTPIPPQRPWYERFGPPVAILLLIAVLCVSAWSSLSPPSAPKTGPTTVAKNEPAEGAAPAEPDKAEVPAAKVGGAAATPENTEFAKKADELAKPGTSDTAKTDATPKAEEPARADLPPGVVGKAEKPSGVLLRFDRDSRLWVQLTAETPLKDQDRILSLQPFRSTLSFGEAKVDLVGETEVWVLSPLPGQAARLHLAQGRIVLHGTPNAAPFSIQFAKKFVNIVPPSGSHVGLERQNRREPGAATASSPVLKISASEGSVAVSVDEAKEKIDRPGSITFEPPGTWIDPDSKPIPTWVVDPKPSTYDLQVGEQFQKFFRDRPVIPTLVEAMDVDQNDVRRLAIFALRAVGDISYVVPLLNRKEDPVTRRAAIAVLRDFLAQAPDSAATLHTQILDYFGEDQAANVEKLIVGYTTKEAGDETTYSELIQLLSSPDVGIRELALDNLQGLTGRDDLKYSPEHPEGAGLRAWKDLLRDHELRPAGTPKSGPKTDKTEDATKDEK